MQYLEITVHTAPAGIDTVVSALTAGGFSDLVIEDQTEFESFLDENRACWDYIDEQLQQELQGLSQIKLYLEDTDTEGLARLTALAEESTLYVKKVENLPEDFIMGMDDSCMVSSAEFFTDFRE